MTGNKRSYRFYPAEQYIPQNSKVVKCDNDVDLEIAKYVANINLENINIDNNLYIMKTIRARIDNAFKSNRGYYDYKRLYKNIEQLYKNSFYFNFSDWKLQRLLHEKDYNLIPICMLALYLRIPFIDLFKQIDDKENNEEIFKNKVIELRNDGMTFKEIANKLNSNCTTVRRTYYNLKS